MSISVTTFRTRFPEFSDETEFADERVQLFIDDAEVYMGSDSSKWCNRYDIAQAYLSAHLLYLADATEAGDASARSGPISSKTAGGVMVTRAVTPKDYSYADGLLSSTAYGSQFLAIRSQCFVGVFVPNGH